MCLWILLDFFVLKVGQMILQKDSWLLSLIHMSLNMDNLRHNNQLQNLWPHLDLNVCIYKKEKPYLN